MKLQQQVCSVMHVHRSAGSLFYKYMKIDRGICITETALRVSHTVRHVHLHANHSWHHQEYVGCGNLDLMACHKEDPTPG